MCCAAISLGHAAQSGPVYGTRATGTHAMGSHATGIQDVPPHAPGYLGILFGTLGADQAAALHVKEGHGVEIVMVDHDGPAGKAGLRPHDVIVSMNGQPVISADDLRHMIHEAGVGAAVSLAVIRSGRKITVNTQLAYRGEVEREAAERMEAPSAQPADTPDPPPAGVSGAATDGTSHGRRMLSEMIHNTPFTGLVVEAMEPQLAGFFGAPAGQGLLVETVLQGSPAERAGLRAGDVILRADAADIRSNTAWLRHLHAAKGQPVVVTILRDRTERTVTLVPELKHKSELVWPLGFDSQPASA